MFRPITLAAPFLLLCACTTAGPSRTPATPAAPADAAAHTATAAAQSSPDPSAHAHAAPPQSPSLPSPVVVPLDAGTLAALPRQPVTATAHGKTQQCEGVALRALLKAADVPAADLHGAQLGRYVLVQARDGYRALFALAEFDPTLGNRPAFVVDRCDGDALDAQAGPLRLLIPGEARPARSVRQVEAITVIVAP